MDHVVSSVGQERGVGEDTVEVTERTENTLGDGDP